MKQAPGLTAYRQDAIFCFLAVLPTFAALVPVVAASAAVRELGDSGGLRAGFLASSIAGLAAGYLVIGNLADRFGQRTSLQASLLAFGAFSLVLYFLEDGPSFLLFRFLQALSSSACMVIPQALYRHTYPGPLARRANAISLLGTAIGPISAFLLGGVFDALDSWRSGFLVCAGSSVVACFSARYLPFGDRLTPVASEIRSAGAANRPGGFLVLALFPACCFTGSYAFFVTAPLIAREELALDGHALALLLCLPPIGLAIGSAAAAAHARYGAGLFVGAVVMQIAVALGAAAMAARPSMLIFAAMLLYGMANGVTVSVSTTAAIARYPGPPGAAAAMAGFIRMAGAAVGAGVLAATTYFQASRALATALAIVAVLLAGLFLPAYRRLATAP